MKVNNISNLITFYNSKNINDFNHIYKVDINTIILNAKNDRRFHKLLGLCIKYDIHIFYQDNNKCELVDIDNLLNQAENKQKKLTKDLADGINSIYTNGTSNGWLIDIENIYNKYKKKFKDIDILIYILKNIYNDKILKNLCCINDDNVHINNNTDITDNTDNVKQKIQKIEKYIAIYSN